MIRLATRGREILDRMGRAAAESWALRARMLTEDNARARAFQRAERMWVEVKPALSALQHDKCAYCERRPLDSGAELTVDHFRPKGAIERYDSPDVPDAGGRSPVGYYLLAYELDNYLLACGRCNTRYKKNYFPTARPRLLDATDVGTLARERPYLICPTDLDDVDPETAIAWSGPIPRPSGAATEHRIRAMTTIRLLGLGKEDLVVGRARMIVDVWLAHDALGGDPIARRVLDGLCATNSPHTSCARSFRRLCDTDPSAARAEYEAAVRLVFPSTAA